MNALVRVNSGLFCAAAVVRDGVVVRHAPILRRWRNKDSIELLRDALGSGWRVEIFDDDAGLWLPVH